MPSPRALIPQRDVKRIVMGFAQAGISVGMTVVNGQPIFLPVDKLGELSPDSALDVWKAKRDADKSRGNS